MCILAATHFICQPGKTARGKETSRALGEDKDMWKQETGNETNDDASNKWELGYEES